MSKLSEICDFLERLAPARLAEDWDNVGLLAGDRARKVQRVMTCLTLTGDSVQEAVDEQADLVVVHHPLPFRGIKRMTTDDPAGRYLWQLLGAQVAIYSPHTSWDSAPLGINQQWAEKLELREISALRPLETNQDLAGSGRCGSLPESLSVAQLAAKIDRWLSPGVIQVVGSPERTVNRLGVACGSAGEFLDDAIQHACDLLITGETSFHTCLDAEAKGIGLMLVGHYASERFALEYLALVLAEAFPDLQVWASRREQSPLTPLSIIRHS